MPKLHQQAADNADRTMCGRDGVFMIFDGRPALLDGKLYAHMLALDGEEVTCAFCARRAAGLPYHGARQPSWEVFLGERTKPYSLHPEAVRSRLRKQIRYR